MEISKPSESGLCRQFAGVVMSAQCCGSRPHVLCGGCSVSACLAPFLESCAPRCVVNQSGPNTRRRDTIGDLGSQLRHCGAGATGLQSSSYASETKGQAADHSKNWEVYDEYVKKNFPDKDDDDEAKQ